MGSIVRLLAPLVMVLTPISAFLVRLEPSLREVVWELVLLANIRSMRVNAVVAPMVAKCVPLVDYAVPVSLDFIIILTTHAIEFVLLDIFLR